MECKRFPRKQNGKLEKILCGKNDMSECCPTLQLPGTTTGAAELLSSFQHSKKQVYDNRTTKHIHNHRIQ
jgi:hypothetical protein